MDDVRHALARPEHILGRAQVALPIAVEHRRQSPLQQLTLRAHSATTRTLAQLQTRIGAQRVDTNVEDADRGSGLVLQQLLDDVPAQEAAAADHEIVLLPVGRPTPINLRMNESHVSR